jgi:hypothetical protein
MKVGIFLKKRKIVIFGMLILFLIGCIFYIGKYTSYQNQKNIQRQAFIGLIYFELNNLVSNLSTVNRWNDNPITDESSHPYYQTLSSLDRIGGIFTDAHWIINNEIIHPDYYCLFGMSNIISSGITINNVKVNNGFLEDRKLSKNEKLFFTTLAEDLNQIYMKMGSNKTNRVNLSLSLDDLNHFFSPIFDKYSFQNIAKTSLSNCK